jgi:hypothetical protein
MLACDYISQVVRVERFSRSGDVDSEKFLGTDALPGYDCRLHVRTSNACLRILQKSIDVPCFFAN